VSQRLTYYHTCVIQNKVLLIYTKNTWIQPNATYVSDWSNIIYSFTYDSRSYLWAYQTREHYLNWKQGTFRCPCSVFIQIWCYIFLNLILYSTESYNQYHVSSRSFTNRVLVRGKFKIPTRPIKNVHWLLTKYEVISKSFRTGSLERELQMVQLSATRCSFIAILWVSLVSFAAIILRVASERMFVVVYFVIDSVRKLLNTPSYTHYRMNLLIPWNKTCFLSINLQCH
jgi:hypothetical protein